MSHSRAAVSSLESQRKGDLRDRHRALAQEELPMPIAPLVASPLQFRRCRPVGEGEEKGTDAGMLPGHRAHLGYLLF